MIVRSHLPWPLRWAAVAVMLGFSAAIALWAFEFGKEIAGLDRGAREEIGRLKSELSSLKSGSEQARSIANTADSLLKAERAAQERLAQQVRQLEAEKAALQTDLGFFEGLLPNAGAGLQVRGLMAEAESPGHLRFQMLVMQPGKAPAEFKGRYEIVLTGQLDGKAWSSSLPGGAQPLQVKQVAKVEGLVEHPPEAAIKAVQVRVIDAHGAVRASQTLKL